jgi:hypothetical protein
MRSVAQDTNLEISLEKALIDEYQRKFLFKLENKIIEILEILKSRIKIIIFFNIF